MKVPELLHEVEKFRDALIEHRDLYSRSTNIMDSDYPIENEEQLRAQSRNLARMLDRLQPFLTRFRPRWLAKHSLTGQTVNVLEVAVGMAHEVQIKGDVLDHAVDGVKQVIGSLQRLGPEDEVPDDPKMPSGMVHHPTDEGFCRK